jgi:cysteine desulfurase
VENLSNVDVHYIGVDKEGFIDVAHLRDMLFYAKNMCNEEILVSIQFANNEIGTIQRIKEIASEVHRFGGVFHTDAVQAFGHTQIDVHKLDIDMMTVSGHKIGTPKGVGFLYKKHSVGINPLIYGTQMDGMRGGTENVPYIMGMAKAVELLQEDTEYQLRLTILRNNFISQLKSLGCSINGSLDERLCNNISITFFQNISGESMVYMLDTCGIYVATGSACNSHAVKASHVLKAIGLSDEDAHKTIRITLSDDITMGEIDRVIRDMSKHILLLSME